jgi:hypothetical protein
MGNPRLAPLSEELLRRWDEGLLSLAARGETTDLQEIRMRFSTVVLCVDFSFSLFRDGTLRYEKQECRKAKGRERPKTYCQVKEGRVWAFDRLARLAVLAESEPLPEEADMGVWIDTPSTYLTLVRKDRTVTIENGGREAPLRRWTFEQAMAGVLTYAEWERVYERPTCSAK